MTRKKMAAALMRRSVRVIVFTVLLTAVGCCGDGDDALSQCLGEITHDPCYIPNVQAVSNGPGGGDCTGAIKVLFIKEGSDCHDCSTCPGSSYGMMTFEPGEGGHSTACIGSCQQLCGQSCAN